jgi:hypothetical protein
MEDLSKDILTDIEKEKIAQFNEDKFLFEAVKKYILAVVYKQGVVEKGVEHNPNINYALNLAWGATQGNGIPRSDEELGQNIRALTLAVQLVGSGFKELAEIKKQVEELEVNENPAE